MWVLFCSTAKCYLEQITCMSCINQKKAVSLGLTPMYNIICLPTYLKYYVVWIMPQNHITNKYVPDICTRC